MRRQMMGLILGIVWLLCGGAAQAATGAQASARRGADPASASARPSGNAAATGVVNVNEATPEQLELLPGVGPTRAKAIVDHRKTHPFKRVEEMTRIKGIGKKTFAKLKPLLALSGPTTLTERPAHAARRQRDSQ